MRILRLTMGFVLMNAFILSSCVKEVSYFEEEIPKGKIVMKNHMPQRVSEEMILEITDINDSRCPVGVVCSSIGAVDIAFKAYINSEFVDFGITYEDLSADQVWSTNFEGHLIEIYRVNPKPLNGEEIDPNDYNVEIKVVKE